MTLIIKIIIYSAPDPNSQNRFKAQIEGGGGMCLRKGG